MSRECLKMSGLGNDFVVIDSRLSPISLSPASIRRIADRSAGIGCDQLIVLESRSPSPTTTSTSSTPFMRMYNGSTGDEAGACGNASRCIAHLLMNETNMDMTEIATISGTIRAWRDQVDATVVSVDMGEPRLAWKEIPLSEEFDTVDVDVGIDDLPHAVAVNVGNPHLVFIMPTMPTVEFVEKYGFQLENHAILPERANISFCHVVQSTEESSVTLITYERGSGLTLACGTGACATVVACVRRDFFPQDVNIRVNMRGGVLDVMWRSDGHVVMTGGYSYDGTRRIMREWL